MAFVFKNNTMKLYNLESKKFENPLPNYLSPLVAKWHPKSSSTNLLAVGCQDGTLAIINRQTKVLVKGNEPDEDPIVDLAWNPGEDLIVVVHASGKMRLYTVKGGTPYIKFEKQANLISAVNWVD
mmetsp:Transcript_14494/g.14108  ORF Transcript_14494/g.14108 Transcript_14494/m.14108 type:complete len:125 (-) Transcript_14494:70-444(-)